MRRIATLKRTNSDTAWPQQSCYKQTHDPSSENKEMRWSEGNRTTMPKKEENRVHIEATT
jgi:hypothetical protein